MYYFGKESDNTDETIFSGTVDETLADNMCSAWTNFARTENPSTDNAEWTEYTTENRETMVIGSDCSMKMENDPKKEQRVLLESFVDYYLK